MDVYVCVGFLLTRHFTPTFQWYAHWTFCVRVLDWALCRGVFQPTTHFYWERLKHPLWPGKGRWLREDRWLFICRLFITHKTSQWQWKIAILHQTWFKSCILHWEMFLSFDRRFKEESRSGFGRCPSMGCNVRYQEPSPQQLWNITDKKAD